MATNKNQHFVPRCYLKAFSQNQEGKAINLFNIDRRELILNAALKNQCSRDYFYGDDQQLEDAIQSFEKPYGLVIQEVLQPGYKLTDEHKRFFKLFWLLQNLRTESASRRQVEIFEGVNSTVGMPQGFIPSMKQAVLQAMCVFAEHMDIVDDLEVCLVKNKSEIKYVTSDDPAIMANRWHQFDRRTRGMSFGTGASGLLAILPLAENIVFVAYDNDVYHIPNKDGWAMCNNASDARAFNQFQYFNCRANIYVSNAKSECEVASSFQKAMQYRPRVRHEIHYGVLESNKDGYKSYRVVKPEEVAGHSDSMLQIQEVFPVPPYWPSQIQWQPYGVVYTNGTGVGYIRRSQIFSRGLSREFWQEPAKDQIKTRKSKQARKKVSKRKRN